MNNKKLLLGCQRKSCSFLVGKQKITENKEKGKNELLRTETLLPPTHVKLCHIPFQVSNTSILQ